MDNTWYMEIGMRIILDVIDIIKKVKKKKAERTVIFREAEAFGLDYDDTASFLQALQEREILLEEDNVFTVVEKERQQVIKGLVNLFKTFSKPITEIKDAATEVSTDFTQDSNNEHHSGSEIEIIRSLSNLADVIVRLQGIIDEERSRSYSLLEENFELKSQQKAIEKKLVTEVMLNNGIKAFQMLIQKTKGTSQPLSRGQKHLLSTKIFTQMKVVRFQRLEKI